MAKYPVAISIDPGVHTGVAIWIDGECKIVDSIHPKGKGGERLLETEQRLDQIVNDLTGYKPKKINIAAVERPHVWTPKKYMNAIITCTQFQTIPIRYFLAHGVPVMEVYRDARKERDQYNRIVPGKVNAQNVCAIMGVETKNEHETDAVYVGFLAGFYAQTP